MPWVNQEMCNGCGICTVTEFTIEKLKALKAGSTASSADLG